MSKLLRGYVANYGLHDAWYDGLLMDFRVNEKPTHTIVNLDNGGGKTTLLSFIFSVIDPRKDYFLKSRQNANHKIVHYFSPDGLPGTCLLEWAAPIPSNLKRVYVTGRSVRIKPNQEVEDIMFCYYKDDASAIDDFPGPNLGSNVPLESWDGLQTWLTERSRKEKSFFKNSVQMTWLERLQEDGIVDSAMIRTQMKFSETEGGVDSFVAFKTQDEFLRKFIELAASEEVLNQVYQSVFQFQSNSAELPALEQKYSEVKTNTDYLSAFQLSQREWNEKKEMAQHASSSVVVLGHNLAGYCLHLTQAAAVAEQEVQTANRNVLSISAQCKHLETVEKYSAALKAFLVHAHTVKVHKDKKSESDRLSECVKHLNFLMLERQIQEKREQIIAIKEQLAQTLIKEAPLREEYSKAAIRFSHALQRDIDVLSKRVQEQRLQIADVNGAIEGTKKSIVGLTRKSAMLQQQGVGLQEKMDLVLKQQKVYETSYQTDISGLEDFAKEAVRALHEERDMQAERVARLSDEKHSIQIAIAQEEQQTKTLQSTLIRINDWLDKQQRLEQKYSNESHLCVFAEGRPNINLPSLVSALNQDIIRQEGEIRKNISASSNLQERISRLETHGPSQPNSNLSTVLQWLHDEGFTQSVSASQYISSLSPEQRTRYLVQYPLGSSGIFVHAEHIDAIREKLSTQALPDIYQNVWLTTFTGQELVPTGGLYVPLNNDTDFNPEKAVALLNSLRQDLVQLLDNIRTQEENVAILRKVVFNIESYQRDYSLSLQEQYQQEKNQQAKDLEHSSNELHRLNSDLSQTFIDIETSRYALKETNAQISSRVPALEHLLRWLAAEYTQLATIEHTLAQIKQETDELNLECTTRAQEQDLKEKKLDALKDQLRRYEAEYANSRQEKILIKIEERIVVDVVLNENTTEYFKSEYLRYQLLWEKTAENADHNLRISLTKYETEMVMHIHQQKQFVVSNSDGLGLTVAQATKDTLDDFDGLLQKSREDVADADVQSKIALQAYSHFRGTVLQEADKGRDSKEVAVAHMRITQELGTARAALDQASSLVSTTTQKGNTAREKLQTALTRKKLFVASLRNIEFSEDNAMPISELDLSSWEEQCSFALEKYAHCATELAAAFKKKETAYQQYERHLDRYSKNLVLKAQEHHDPALMDDEALIALIRNLHDVMAAMEHQIVKYQTSQSTVASELMNVSTKFALMLEDALGQKVPANAPLIGGKNVLKVKSTKTPFSPLGPEERLSRINMLLDTYLTGARLPSGGRDLVAQAIAALYGKPLDFCILKMVENEKEHYSLVDQVRNSGAEGVTMALCLYMLILSVRSKPEKGRTSPDSGALIIDNPFAKATTYKFWEALHTLADQYGIQFIFLTASSDPETLRNFQHYIALSKKLDSVSGKRILTDARITFAKKEIPDASANMV